MDKVVIVNCFDTYEDRIDLLHDFFSNKGFSVTVIQSDFKHFKKEHRKDKKKDFIFVESKPYYKNMSVARLTSHYEFAKTAFDVVDEIKPDLLYVMIPPNSLAKFAANYKRKHTEVKLVFDLIDLWPETMPVGRVKNIPPFTLWRAMRDKHMNRADFVITECDLYQTVLSDVLKQSNTATVYLAKRDIHVVSNPNLSIDEINLCYLGSINNIIDISKIKAIVESFNNVKPTTLHIIGDGESKDLLINAVTSTGANVEYHGKIYDSQKKQDIFDQCHFGLNIMKNTVCVGLTMKSIDYFQHGLPILNNIQADTTKMVNEYDTGYNITDENINDAISKIVNLELSQLLMMRKNTLRMFNQKFSVQTFNENIDEIISKL